MVYFFEKISRQQKKRVGKELSVLSVFLSIILSILSCLLSCLYTPVLLDFSLTVKAATLIFISGFGSAISSAKEGKAGFIYNLVKS